VMPKLSPTMEEGQLSRWLKKEGDKVSMGEPLAEIDTDKATMEMQSLANGVLLKILVNEGESAPLGDPIAIVGAEGEDISNLIGAKKSAKEEAPTAKPEADETEEREQEPKKAAAVAKPAPKEEAPRPVTPPSRSAWSLRSVPYPISFSPQKSIWSGPPICAGQSTNSIPTQRSASTMSSLK